MVFAPLWISPALLKSPVSLAFMPFEEIIFACALLLNLLVLISNSKFFISPIFSKFPD